MLLIAACVGGGEEAMVVASPTPTSTPSPTSPSPVPQPTATPEPVPTSTNILIMPTPGPIYDRPVTPLPLVIPEPTATPVPTDIPAPTPPPSAAFGSGAFRVGADISPGTYQNSDSSRGCYWARLLGFSGGFEDIIASKFDFIVQIVTVRPSDVGFSSIGCGDWTRLE